MDAEFQTFLMGDTPKPLQSWVGIPPPKSTPTEDLQHCASPVFRPVTMP